MGRAAGSAQSVSPCWKSWRGLAKSHRTASSRPGAKNAVCPSPGLILSARWKAGKSAFEGGVHGGFLHGDRALGVAGCSRCCLKRMARPPTPATATPWRQLPPQIFLTLFASSHFCPPSLPIHRFSRRGVRPACHCHWGPSGRRRFPLSGLEIMSYALKRFDTEVSARRSLNWRARLNFQGNFTGTYQCLFGAAPIPRHVYQHSGGRNTW